MKAYSEYDISSSVMRGDGEKASTLYVWPLVAFSPPQPQNVPWATNLSVVI